MVMTVFVYLNVNVIHFLTCWISGIVELQETLPACSRYLQQFVWQTRHEIISTFMYRVRLYLLIERYR